MQVVLYADGYLQAEETIVPAVYGRKGIGQKYQEGDEISPEGTWPMRQIFYRRDRVGELSTRLPLQSLTPLDAWCDKLGDPKYNQHVTLPYKTVNEKLWREDPLYDMIVVLGYNDNPILQGKGSAIFLHVFCSPELPTAGCAGIARENLAALIPYFTLKSTLTFTAKSLKSGPIKWPYIN